MVPFSNSLNLHNSVILLKLARFVSSREQRSIRKDLISIIPQDVDIRPDEWAKQRRILLKIPKLKAEKSEELLTKIAEIPGILTIVIFKKNNFDFATDKLSELVNYTLDSVNGNEKPLYIKFQSIGSLPFHKRALKERINKKTSLSKIADETTFNVYLECKEQNSQILSRLGFMYKFEKEEHLSSSETEILQDLDITKNKISVILFSPYTAIEIADFCRMSLNFDFLEVLFSNENEKVPEVLEETSKTLFKGIDKVKYEVIPSLNDFISKNRYKYSFLGFSLHASKNARDLKKALKNSDKIPCVVIGNEVRGLEYSTQKMIDMFRLGTGSSEPLRASHVIAYVLGMIA